MKDLVYKELKLALHPAAIIFLCLSSMLMIPSYPYFIIFFYTCLGVFFICMSGRENKDIYFTMLLPVQKREIVGARFLLVALIELLQFAAAVPFASVSYTHLSRIIETAAEKNSLSHGERVKVAAERIGFKGNIVFPQLFFQNVA